MRKKLIAFVLSGIAMNACKNSENSRSEVRSSGENIFPAAYVGTYTQKEPHVDGKAEGIYLVQIDTTNGQLAPHSQVASGIVNPSFLAISPDKKNLYAVSEIGPRGYIFSYSINDDLSLKFIDSLSTDEAAPCHVNLDSKGEFVFVANYLGGVVKMYARSNDGRLVATDRQLLRGSGPHQEQDASHLHSVVISPDDQFALIADKGADKIWIFSIDSENGKLISGEPSFVKLPSGAGPRHFKFHPNGKWVYVINELNNTVSSLEYESETGVLHQTGSVSTLPAAFEGPNSSADIHIHPNGRYLYASNRGHNSIAVIEINAENGRLTLLSHTSTEGSTPRNFAIDPSGSYLYAANQDTDTIVLFKIDKQTGKLIFTDHKLDVPTPVCFIRY